MELLSPAGDFEKLTMAVSQHLVVGREQCPYSVDLGPHFFSDVIFLEAFKYWSCKGVSATTVITLGMISQHLV